MSPPDQPLSPEQMWRVFVDSLDPLPDSELVDTEDWVQLRTPSSKSPGHNRVLRARLTDADADDRIAQVVADHVARGASLGWLIEARSTPSDLADRLRAHGVPFVARALGMVRAVPDTPPPPLPAGIRLERAVADDVERLGWIGAQAWERPPAFARRVSNWMERVFAGESGEVACWLAYLDDELVGSSVLRVLPTLGYMQGASVVRRARGRGIYQALTWIRLEHLHRRGISHAVIWAHETTSAPIARKMGFRALTSAAYHEREADGGA